MDNAIETLCEGFFEDPLFTYAFPDPKARSRIMPLLFGGALRHSRHWGGVFTTGDGAAVAAWVPRERMAVTLSDALRFGMLSVPLRAGLQTWSRFSRYEKAADEATHVHGEPDGRFAYLWMVCASNRRRGEGLGRAVVEGAQRQMSEAGFETCILRTQQPRNVGLYRHLGFDELGRFTPPGSDLPTVIFRRALPAATETASFRASA